ncbi:pepsin-like aspartic protease [Marinicella meishanensis]|uniref:pepsin-like aspartic protease n=1 Tax=Marinicella meishanensis TaxID=2873263 RepID=UPI001CBACA00|nr:pepsin-like aspartic protease [Marinicella sp. NBU2979]
MPEAATPQLSNIGSQGAQANLILDSGSSALVIQGEDYQPGEDDSLTTTCFAQNRTYGMGGWFGPVVKTRIHMGRGPFSVSLEETHVAVTRKEQQNSFAEADGIMGLAYYELNRAYDLTDYLTDNNVSPAATYPWFLADEQQDDTVREFKGFLKTYPKSYLTPYFTQLEQQGVVGNQFGFVIHRSSIYQTSQQRSQEALRKHPLNRGFFVLGKPKIHTSLFQGKFKKVKVLDDKYHNVHVRSMRVGNSEPIAAPELDEADRNHRTNGIIDSGASFIVLPQLLFDHLLEALIKVNADCEALLDPYRSFTGVEMGVDLAQIDLAAWPSIYFVFDGAEEDEVELELKPKDYWQVHAPAPNQASFQFTVLAGWPNQCILGLPLMASYFTIFDRAAQPHGVIQFADKA